MNVYRNVPGLKSSSKATPTTLCQKCLKKDTYECKASAQERPYRSRPSRTQQLQNPKLVPQLTSDVPNDLLPTKGVTDEELAKKEKERGRKREVEDEDDVPGQGHATKRARSLSSHSSSSVSTISTDRSRSHSPKRGRYDTKDSVSASPRGRDSPSPAPESGGRKRRYSDSSSDYSYSSRSSIGRRRSYSREPDRISRRRRNERSPDERGRAYNPDRRGSWRARSKDGSMDKSRIARERHSLTPAMAAPDRSEHEDRRGSHAGNRKAPRDHSRGRHENRRTERTGADDRTSHQAPPPPKERSLSPFSKRLALTQAMNMGR